jgi:hypothetical protein
MTESEIYENISSHLLFISLAKPESQCFMSITDILFQNPNLNITFWSDAVANLVEVRTVLQAGISRVLFRIMPLITYSMEQSPA